MEFTLASEMVYRETSKDVEYLFKRINIIFLSYCHE